MSRPAEVLVAILKHPRDLEIARQQHWYRIPIEQIAASFQKHGPPDWLAFYQTKAFGAEAYSIRYYARVLTIQTVNRVQLFPEESENAQKRYFKLELSPLQPLPQPIVSTRDRRVLFIFTTFNQLTTATELRQLYASHRPKPG